MVVNSGRSGSKRQVLAAIVLTGALGTLGLVVSRGTVSGIAGPVPLEKRVRSVFVMTPLDVPELVEGKAVYAENLPARSGEPMLCRSERRYEGVLPTTNELAFYLRQGMGDAFLYALRPEHKARIMAELAPVEAAYGAASLRRHQEMEAAKARTRGTQDEYSIESLTEEGRARKRALFKRKDQADLSRERWVSQSTSKVEVHYRIDLARFPSVAEFEREAVRHDALRVALAHERVAAVLSSLGPEALDTVALAAAVERGRAARRRAQ